MFRPFVFIYLALAIAAAWAHGLPGMAAGILKQTAQARQAIVLRDAAAALDHVNQALALADEIQEQAPSRPRPLLIPVYKELDSTSTYGPVKGKEGQLSARRLKKDTAVREVQGETTIGRLDVTSAADRLQSAQAALQRNDWTAADTALAAIPNSIIRTSVENRLPLLKARENLTLARDRVLDGKYTAAAAPLRAAAQALANFEKLSPGPKALEAESMRLKILDYARDIQHNHADAARQIDVWLDPVSQWEREFSK